ncbi:MAG TPA: alanine--tRNA ligase [Burkholderiales bacterium]
MNVSEIREKFLSYFESKGHTRAASSSLVPGNDPTLLFTNSGMVQFKDVFIGTDVRSYKRATTAQRSVRAGGKHNDLENVGYTARHHTFFEMLGNFSFGDYFKRDAIKFAWELLTEVYKLPKDKLWVTVYIEDDEAFDIWEKEVGVPKERIVRIGDNKGAKYASDNFWQMADTGPCGPCSEIFYDHGPEVAGGPPGSPEQDGDRYIEIWNLVFMQFDRQPNGEMPRLPKPCVDTGMGLERIAAVLQHVHSNYEIDLFVDLIKAAGRETNTKDLGTPSLKVIADHIRACSFLIVDGVIPSNDGRGYVLRRIIRRALRHGNKLGQTKPFFHALVKDLVAQMGKAYPELKANAKRVEETLLEEELKFAETLSNGMKILDAALAREGNMLDGETVFTLYDTYGFPVDLTADVARERGKNIDIPGYEAAMQQAKKQSQEANKGRFKMAAGVSYDGGKTNFKGYEALSHEGAKVVALYLDGTPVQQLSTGEHGIVVLDATPFYAESGGQVGDKGELVGAGGSFDVADTQKIQPDVYGHHGTLKSGALKVGDTVEARVDTARRAAIARNHSVTHLMHKALREVLGGHVAQRGSLVDDEKTRFDFVQNKPLTAAEIRQVEEKVNAEILSNTPTRARVLPIEEAKQTGAMMLFGEKYGEEVRVLDIGSSRELCGGTHVGRTGDIGPFKIYSEGGVAAGIRRVEATTGTTALNLMLDQTQELSEIARSLKVGSADVEGAIGRLQEEKRNLEKELAKLKGKLASNQGDELVAQAVDVKGVKVLAATLEGADSKALLETMDKLKDKLKTAAIVLSAVNGGKVVLIAGVTKDATAKVKAGDLLNFVAQQVGGKGGGKPEMAQGSGSEPDKLPAALAGVKAWVEERV